MYIYIQTFTFVSKAESVSPVWCARSRVRPKVDKCVPRGQRVNLKMGCVDEPKLTNLPSSRQRARWWWWRKSAGLKKCPSRCLVANWATLPQK